MFSLYDELINSIPSDLKVVRAAAGNFWTAVESELGVGVAGTVNEMSRPMTAHFKYEGAELKKLAELSKSWNYVEASIGVAAINAYYNSPSVAEKNGVLFSQGDERLNDPYIAYRNYARDKKAGYIGHHQSKMVDSMLGDVAQLSYFGEGKGEYPMAAADYLLPEQDIIFLPCYFETSKDLPRYLKLAEGKLTVICGPSITMSPILFKYGVFDMSGLVISDPDMAFESALGPDAKLMFAAGKKAALRKEDIRRLRR